jgi:hypothetical protein
VYKNGWDDGDDDWECDRWWGWAMGEDADTEIAGDGCDALLTGVPPDTAYRLWWACAFCMVAVEEIV